MARVALSAGDYQARSIIAGAQRCVNLYQEAGAADSPVPFTYYPTPGLTQFAAGNGQPGRMLYTASNGQLYYLRGATLYAVSSSWTLTAVGAIDTQTGPAYLSDNSATAILVDGSAQGYSLVLADNTFEAISDVAFYGGSRIDYVDTFFLISRPGTNQFYLSPSNWAPGIAFDPLDIVARSGAADPISGLLCLQRNPWVIGTQTSEVYFDVGASDFAFQELPGSFMEHGCVASASIAKADISCFWLAADKQGQTIVVQGTNYTAKKISTDALDHQMQQYGTVSDAIGWTQQQDGHVFYWLTFPTEDVTWCFDLQTERWHQRMWLDGDGTEHRHRANCFAYAYGKAVVADWQTGALYALDLNAYTDNGAPIERRIGFPHIQNDGKRVFHRQFIADMQSGTDDGSVDGSNQNNPPPVFLRWSDTRGASWGNAISTSLGATGQFFNQLQFQRLGMARDRIYEVSWSAPCMTAINGAFLQTGTAAT